MSRPKKSRRRYESDSDSSMDSEEEDWKKDLQEWDEFAGRLKKKAKTRNIVHASEKKAYEEAAKRLQLEHAERDKIIPKLRVELRRKYLEKHKEDKLVELEADIQDDEYLFEEKVWVSIYLFLENPSKK